MKQLLPLALVFVAGCGGSPGTVASTTSPAPGGLTITSTDDFRFVPAAVSARAGDIRLVLVNHGSYPHNLSLPDLHVTSKTVTGSPGSTSTVLTFRAAPGKYRFVCTFHSNAGMTGELTVTP